MQAGRIALAAMSVAAVLLVRSAQATTLYSDTYSTDTSANYTSADESGASSTWAVNSGVLTYTRNTPAAAGWQSSDFLLNSSVASTSGLTTFTVSGTINSPSHQPALVVSADNTLGGYTLEADAANNQWSLLRETGAEMLNDEGGSGNPPVLATFGGFSGSDSYNVSVTVVRGASSDTLYTTIVDTTSNTTLANSVPTVNSTNFGSADGTLIGWRTRGNIAGGTTIGDTMDNLTLTNTPEPASVGLLALAGIGLLARRRKSAVA